MSMDAWRYYKSRIEQLLQGIDYYMEPYPEVLKTDVFNEIRSLPDVGGVTRTSHPVTFVYVDNNPEYITQFKSMYPSERAYLMDIRDLQFSPERFDMVIDASTCDHFDTSGLEQCFSEYYRVLKDGATALIITWTGEIGKKGEQFYHPRGYVEEILNKYFTILNIKDDIIPHDNFGGVLVAYTLSKKD